MRTTLLALLLGAALLGVGLACSDDEPEDTLTLSEYFAQMDLLRESSESEYLAAQQASWDRHAESPPESDQERLDLDRERILDVVGIMRSVAVRIENIRPPDPAKDPHSDYASALQDYAGGMEEYTTTDAHAAILLERPALGSGSADGLEGAIDERTAFFEGLDLGYVMEPLSRLKEACSDLIAIASENSIDAEPCME